jgi:hypothetical protein
MKNHLKTYTRRVRNRKPHKNFRSLNNLKTHKQLHYARLQKTKGLNLIERIKQKISKKYNLEP